MAPSAGERLDEDDESGSNALALAGAKRRLVVRFSWVTLIWHGRRWYWEAHVTVPGQVNFYGSTLVGIPALRAGFNDRLGYVQTNNGPDLQDIYALPLAEGRPDVFLQNGRPRDIERRRIVVDVKQPDGSFAVQERDYEHTRLGLSSTEPMIVCSSFGR